jgi:hypothetical protein
MGQKVNPIGCACRSTAPGTAAGSPKAKDYGPAAGRPQDPRVHPSRRCKQAAISKVVIERPHKKCRVTIHAARPGVIIGKKGADIEKLRKKLGEFTKSERAPQHRRSPQAGSRRQAGRQVDRPAAGTPRRLPSRDEARVQSAMRLGAEGIRSPAPAVLAAPKSPGPNGTAKAACRCTRCAPTSTMPKPTATPLMACAASRSGSSRAKSSVMIRWRPTG